MDTRARILFIVNDFSIGGAEKHVVTLLNHLDTSRFRLGVVHLKNNTDLVPQIDGAQVEGGIVCAHVAARLDLAAARRLARIIDAQRADVVVCTNAYSLLYGWLALRFSPSRAALVEVFHSTGLPTRKARLQMALYRPLFRAADLVVFVCEAQRSFWEARRLQVRSAAVIHNGIDVAYFRNDFRNSDIADARARLGFTDADFVVGICAALRREKAHVDLLDALAELKRAGHRVKCLMIGDGPERAAIERAIATRQLAADVVVTGFTADIRPYVAACDVMTLVSHSETFSLSALETMALGKPVVMSDVGGAAEQVRSGHDGLLYPARDTGALARSLLAMRSANVDGAIGVNARRSVVDRFALAGMVSKFEHTFAALAHARKGA